VEPLYFGRAERRLYGVYHPPSQPSRRAAVLLCYPSVQEYMRAHWAFRRLGGMLAREGFPVLRFDYYGTGDSAGDYREATIDLWCSNIREAATELQELADVREISMIGLQLGATLAAQAVARGQAVRDLVLWEPAAEGRAHIRDLRSLEKLKYEIVRQGPRIQARELLGYEFPPEVAADLARAAFPQVTCLPTERILIFAAKARPAHSVVIERLRDRAGRAPEVHIVPEEAESGAHAALLATRVMHAMTAALAGASV